MVIHYSQSNGSDWKYLAPDGSSGQASVRAVHRASAGEYLRDAAIAGADSGAPFVILNEHIESVVLEAGELSAQTRWHAASEGASEDDEAEIILDHRNEGRALRPLSPARLNLENDNGDITISWIRRSRQPDSGWALPEVPLAEESERYEICVREAGEHAIRRRWIVTTTQTEYPHAQRISDFGDASADIAVDIRQLGLLPGIARTGIIHV